MARRDGHPSDGHVPHWLEGRLHRGRQGNNPDPEHSGPRRPELSSASDLAACYKQLNSSVGELGTATLQASTNAIESSSPGDSIYTQTETDLRALDKARDHLAIQIKDELWGAEFGHHHISGGLAKPRRRRASRLSSTPTTWL